MYVKKYTKKKDNFKVNKVVITYNYDGTFTLSGIDKKDWTTVSIARIGLISGYTRLPSKKKLIYTYEKDKPVEKALKRFTNLLYRPMMGDDQEHFIKMMARFLYNVPKGGIIKVFLVDNHSGEVKQTEWRVMITRAGILVIRPKCFKGGNIWRKPKEKYIDFAHRIFNDIIKNLKLKCNGDQYSIMLKEMYLRWDFTHIPSLVRKVKLNDDASDSEKESQK